MRTRTAGIAALIAAAGIWISFSGAPAMAAKSTAKPAAKSSVAAADRPMVLSKFKKQRRAQAAKKTRTHHARHVKKNASKASSKAVAQKSVTKKVAEKDDAAKPFKPELTPEVANARAEALARDEARNIAALDSANVSSVNGVLVAAADQPNESNPPMDNAAQDSSPAPPVAVAPPLPASNGQIIRAVSSSEKPVFKGDDSDPWSKTSLIGKIFIAFGSLLTLASAARLFIA